tara:strand:- start:672 stop:773 length:102 start_codon:yes stop_codon:yes gene_type:complete
MTKKLLKYSSKLLKTPENSSKNSSKLLKTPQNS